MIVLHGDGWCEVFADNADAHVALMLDTKGVPEAERTAEEYLEASLPRRFRKLHYSPKLRAVGQCESRGPESELQRLQDLRVVRGLRPATPAPKLRREPVKARLA